MFPIDWLALNAAPGGIFDFWIAAQMALTSLPVNQFVNDFQESKSTQNYKSMANSSPSSKSVKEIC